MSSFIQKKIQERMRGGAPPRDLVEVPDKYKGLVIGKGGDNLRHISTLTGAKLTSWDNELYIVSGTEEQRQRAKIEVKMKVVTRSLRSISIDRYDLFLDNAGAIST